MIFPTADAVARAVADWLVEQSRATLVERPRFTIALSGGSTPKKLFELLAQPPYRDQIEWTRWHVFWGDERAVPFRDERNNARMTYRALLDHVAVPTGQIFPWRTDVAPAQSAAEYGQRLHEYFDGQDATFDVVLLGLGDNSHTLSLFPGYPVVHENVAWTAAFYLDEQQMHRLTLTAPVVNLARNVAFVVTGADKAAAVQAVRFGPYDPDHHPAQQIKPQNATLLWFLDDAAAGAT